MIRSEEYNGVCVLSVDGELSGDSVAEVRQVVDDVVARHDARGIVFDLDGCEFIDSAGLELLCRIRRRCEIAGKKVTLTRVGSTCAKILEVTRLAGRFDCHPDLDRALKATR
jgi:anti-anti-sigma factor